MALGSTYRQRQKKPQQLTSSSILVPLLTLKETKKHQGQDPKKAQLASACCLQDKKNLSVLKTALLES